MHETSARERLHACSSQRPTTPTGTSTPNNALYLPILNTAGLDSTLPTRIRGLPMPDDTPSRSWGKAAVLSSGEADGSGEDNEDDNSVLATTSSPAPAPVQVRQSLMQWQSSSSKTSLLTQVNTLKRPAPWTNEGQQYQGAQGGLASRDSAPRKRVGEVAVATDNQLDSMREELQTISYRRAA